MSLDLTRPHKKVELTLDMSSKRQAVINGGEEFFTMDSGGTAVGIFNFRIEEGDGEFKPLDLTDVSEILIGFYFTGSETSMVLEPEILEAKNGRVALVLPNQFAYSGTVLGYTYILWNDRKLDGGEFRLTFTESWLDSELEEMDEFYVQRFEDLAEEIRQRVEDIKTEMDNELNVVKGDISTAQTDIDRIQTQIDNNEVVRRTGDTMSGRLTLQQGSVVHTANGVAGTAGWIRIARVRASGHGNALIELTIVRRGDARVNHLAIRFSNNSAPASSIIDRFTFRGDERFEAHVVKTTPAGNEWDLIIRKTESHDNIAVVHLSRGNANTPVVASWLNDMLTTLPAGTQRATPETVIATGATTERTNWIFNTNAATSTVDAVATNGNGLVVGSGGTGNDVALTLARNNTGNVWSRFLNNGGVLRIQRKTGGATSWTDMLSLNTSSNATFTGTITNTATHRGSWWQSQEGGLGSAQNSGDTRARYRGHVSMTQLTETANEWAPFLSMGYHRLGRAGTWSQGIIMPSGNWAVAHYDSNRTTNGNDGLWTFERGGLFRAESAGTGGFVVGNSRLQSNWVGNTVNENFRIRRNSIDRLNITAEHVDIPVGNFHVQNGIVRVQNDTELRRAWVGSITNFDFSIRRNNQNIITVRDGGITINAGGSNRNNGLSIDGTTGQGRIWVGNPNFIIENPMSSGGIHFRTGDHPTSRMVLAHNGNASFTHQVTAPTFVGPLIGNASTASQLSTPRNITIGNTSRSFNGAANVDWTLDDIGAAPAVADTGWRDLTPQNGATRHPDDERPQYRRIGNTVHLRGAFTNVLQENLTVATLPVGFRPIGWSYPFVQNTTLVGSNAFFARWSIETDGRIQLVRINNPTGLVAGRWFPIHTSFLID